MNYMQHYANRLTQQQVDQMGFSIFSPIDSTKAMVGNMATIVMNKVVYVLKWVVGGFILLQATKFGWRKFKEYRANKATQEQFAALQLQVQQG